MLVIDPNQVFKGVILITAPHMDDEVLACGGTIARLSQRNRIHVAYATDGTQSPVPLHSSFGSAAPDLALIRKQEARAALKVLGLAERNIHFLALPDGGLKHHMNALNQSLVELMKRLKPERILVPFRYDRHPDHLALNRAVVQMLQSASSAVELIEYFVYYRWQLLPGRDVRKFIRPDQLMHVDIRAHSAQKKRALECFKSQTTCFFDWQERPILTHERVNQVSQSPELFLRYDPNLPGAAIFAEYGAWIRFVHLVEPILKQKKEQILALLRAGITRNGRKSN
jgi:LmbE family N-acetylglucosaminyl deacetylase